MFREFGHTESELLVSASPQQSVGSVQTNKADHKSSLVICEK